MTMAFLGSKSTILRPLDRSEYRAAMFEWVNDDEATHFMATGTLPATLEAIDKSYDAILAAANEIVLAVADKKTGTYIGNVGLYQINGQTRSAEYRIFLGHNGFRGKGHGTEAAQLMIGYAFERLNLNKVWLGVSDANLGAIRSYEKAGFVREGILRQEIYRNGRYYDAIRMSILAREYVGHGPKK